jgi:hypothetical protein
VLGVPCRPCLCCWKRCSSFQILRLTDFSWVLAHSPGWTELRSKRDDLRASWPLDFTRCRQRRSPIAHSLALGGAGTRWALIDCDQDCERLEALNEEPCFFFVFLEHLATLLCLFGSVISDLSFKTRQKCGYKVHTPTHDDRVINQWLVHIGCGCNPPQT